MARPTTRDTAALFGRSPVAFPAHGHVAEGLRELVEIITRERDEWKATAEKLRRVEIGPKVPAILSDRESNAL